LLIPTCSAVLNFTAITFIRSLSNPPALSQFLSLFYFLFSKKEQVFFSTKTHALLGAPLARGARRDASVNSKCHVSFRHSSPSLTATTISSRATTPHKITY
jgi:hypothetical protein